VLNKDMLRACHIDVIVNFPIGKTGWEKKNMSKLFAHLFETCKNIGLF